MNAVVADYEFGHVIIRAVSVRHAWKLVEKHRPSRWGYERIPNKKLEKMSCYLFVPLPKPLHFGARWSCQVSFRFDQV